MDYNQFATHDVTGIYNLCRRHQKMYRDDAGRPAVFGHETCGGIFIYAGENRTATPSDFEYRLERYIKPERGSAQWREFQPAWTMVFYAESNNRGGSHFWVVRIEGDEELFRRDWVILKLHTHLWKHYGGQPG